MRFLLLLSLVLLRYEHAIGEEPVPKLDPDNLEKSFASLQECKRQLIKLANQTATTRNDREFNLYKAKLKKELSGWEEKGTNWLMRVNSVHVEVGAPSAEVTFVSEYRAEGQQFFREGVTIQFASPQNAIAEKDEAGDRLWTTRLKFGDLVRVVATITKVNVDHDQPVVITLFPSSYSKYKPPEPAKTEPKSPEAKLKKEPKEQPKTFQNYADFVAKIAIDLNRLRIESQKSGNTVKYDDRQNKASEELRACRGKEIAWVAQITQVSKQGGELVIETTTSFPFRKPGVIIDIRLNNGGTITNDEAGNREWAKTLKRGDYVVLTGVIESITLPDSNDHIYIRFSKHEFSKYTAPKKR